MTTETIEKLYIILEGVGKNQAGKLEDFLCLLFPYLNFTSNIYILAPSLSQGLPQAERMQKHIKTFLRDHRFVRFYLHFIHPLPQGSPDDIDYFYQYYYQAWRRGSVEFDREGYSHQEIPRYVLYTLVAPNEKDSNPFLEAYLGMLQEALLFPSLYLQEDTFVFLKDKGIQKKVKKIYYGSGKSSGQGQLASNLCAQDLVEASCVDLRTQAFSQEKPCAPAIFVNGVNGLVYPCMDAFSAGDTIACAYENIDPEALVTKCQIAREKERDCAVCKKRETNRFSRLPLPGGLREEVDGLVRHLERK